MVAYTGNSVDRWFGKAVIDLAGLSFSKKPRPIFRQHDVETILGHTTGIKNDKKQLTLDGVFSFDNKNTEEVINSAKNGFPWQASVGIHATKTTEVEAGETVIVNGRKFVGPLTIFAKTELLEVSFLPLGADDDTSVVVNAEREEQNKLTKHFTEDKTRSEKTKGTAETENLTTNTETENSDTIDFAAEMREKSASELTRQAEIVKLCGSNIELAAQAVRENWTLEKTELESNKLELAAMREDREGAPAAHVKQSHCSNKVLEASFGMNFGLSPESLDYSRENPEGFSEQTMNEAMELNNRGAGLYELSEATCRAAGVHFKHGDRVSNWDSFVDAIQKLSDVGPHSIGGILGNTVNKSVAAAYGLQAGIAERVCKVGSENDFKAFTRYIANAECEFLPLTEGGNIQSGKISEESSSSSLETVARKIAFTRQQYVNDDLGELQKIPNKIGRNAKRAVEKALAIVINTAAFYTAGRNNLITGAAGILQPTALSTAVTAMLKQVDSAGDPIAVAPWALIVSAGNSLLANDLTTHEFFNETTTANKPKTTRNSHAGKYQAFASPWLHLTNNGVAGSDIAWYLIANPLDIETFALTFLRGRRTPVVNIDRFMKNSQAIEFESYYDFKVSSHDWRGVQKSVGA